MFQFSGHAGGRHGDRAVSHASQSGESGDAVRQKGEEQEGHDCGLSLEQLMHEDVGAKQALRSEDQQNKFVAGLIRRGLYKDGWKLVITGHITLPMLAQQVRL